ncbi:hypothetical protein ASD53_15485 [Lysobacter sp. Root559]|nr:hypothetical protein ASD53_15485 [Lysobacter sp. Root559]KRC32663.1 hypothetical protein ASE10_13850 [Lysobacter sp. Root76]KRD67993.1 hypothetical protein ASE45_14910 [Lysobacter sp. Root96]
MVNFMEPLLFRSGIGEGRQVDATATGAPRTIARLQAGVYSDLRLDAGMAARRRDPHIFGLEATAASPAAAFCRGRTASKDSSAPR